MLKQKFEEFFIMFQKLNFSLIKKFLIKIEDFVLQYLIIEMKQLKH